MGDAAARNPGCYTLSRFGATPIYYSMGNYTKPIFSVKGRCAFNLGATSFVYPADYADNVERLGPYFDEIELLFLESRNTTDRPTPKLIDGLREQKLRLGLDYNIHLPMDITPNAPDTFMRRNGIEVLADFIRLTQPLEPLTYCLHLPWDNKPDFTERCAVTLTELLKTGLEPAKLTVENLNYPLTILKDLLDDLEVGVCLDVGHTIAFETGLETHLNAFRDRIYCMHLHASGTGDDHSELGLLGRHAAPVLEFLQSYSGSVSLELFNITALNKSLAWLRPYLEL